MAFSCNLSKTDRTIRTVIGAAMTLAAVALIRYRLAAILLAATGLATVVGAVIGF